MLEPRGVVRHVGPQSGPEDRLSAGGAVAASPSSQAPGQPWWRPGFPLQEDAPLSTSIKSMAGKGACREAAQGLRLEKHTHGHCGRGLEGRGQVQAAFIGVRMGETWPGITGQEVGFRFP